MSYYKTGQRPITVALHQASYGRGCNILVMFGHNCIMMYENVTALCSDYPMLVAKIRALKGFLSVTV